MTNNIVDQYGRPTSFAHAADRSRFRGPQYAVSKDYDIDRLIPSRDRKTLVNLSRRLCINMGVPQACILQKADYSVGEAWLPQYLGPDIDQAKGIEKFMRDVWYPQCDTRGGMFDWWKLLELSSICIDREGEIFWVMIKGDDDFPRIQLIPSHRCHSGDWENGKAAPHYVPTGKYAGLRICDGIIYNKYGRPAAYRFQVGYDKVPQMVEIPAFDVIHVFDPTHCEQGRGLPAFTHALESLKMSLFSTEDERIRQQLISRMHLTIFNDTGGPDIDDPIISSGDDPNNAADFSTKVFPGGVMYASADSNQRIEQMRHDNPGPIWDAFQDRIIRDAVISVWSYNVWKGAGQGTDSRAEIVKCRRFVTRRQGQLWVAARRAFTWAYSVFASTGKVGLLEKPTAWDFSRPPRLSVDDGRESKMELDELITGSRNLEEVLAARGLNEDEFLYRRAWSVAKRKAIAAQVSQDASSKFGVDINVEDREMFMQTANEPKETEPVEDIAADNLKPDLEDE